MVDEIEAKLNDLGLRIDRLKILYEQYFLGIERAEPVVPRKEVMRLFEELRQNPIRNTALRFRHTTLTHKWNSYTARWGKTLREIELGTYTRHVARAQRRGVELPPELLARSRVSVDGAAPVERPPSRPPPTGEAEPAHGESLSGLLDEIDDGTGSFIFENKGAPAPRSPPSRPPERLQGPLIAPPPPSTARRPTRTTPPPPSPQPIPMPPSRRMTAEGPLLTGGPPQPSSSPPPPPPDRPPPPGGPRPPSTFAIAQAGSSTRSVREAPMQTLMGLGPVEPPPHAAPLAPPPPGRPSATAEGAHPAAARPGPRGPTAGYSAVRDDNNAPAIPGMDEPALRALHQRYLDERKKSGAAEVRYEVLVASLKKQVPDLLARHKTAALSFEVAVRDGRVIVQARPKR